LKASIIQIDYEVCIIHICFTLSGSRVLIVDMLYVYLLWDFFQEQDLGTYSVLYQGCETVSLACASMIFLWWCLIQVGISSQVWSTFSSEHHIFCSWSLRYLQFWLKHPLASFFYSSS